jgi:hypothetical protein
MVAFLALAACKGGSITSRGAASCPGGHHAREGSIMPKRSNMTRVEQHARGSNMVREERHARGSNMLSGERHAQGSNMLRGEQYARVGNMLRGEQHAPGSNMVLYCCSPWDMLLPP